MRRKILLGVLFLLLCPVVGGAWLIGDFQIPAKPVREIKPQPKPVVRSQTDSGSSYSSLSSSVSTGSGSTSGSTFTDPVTGMEFVWVPNGCFQMGSSSGEKGRDSDEGPVHRVCVDGFWIGKYEVTQGQWQKVMGNNPSYFKKGSNYPVEQVSWDDCQSFIKKLNRQSRKTFRLPTEAEWEYAARGGRSGEKYAGGNDVDRVAWYSGNSGGSTHPVGRYYVQYFNHQYGRTGR